jgi:hypothetical protein
VELLFAEIFEDCGEAVLQEIRVAGNNGFGLHMLGLRCI